MLRWTLVFGPTVRWWSWSVKLFLLPQWSTASCTIFGWVTTTATPTWLDVLLCSFCLVRLEKSCFRNKEDVIVLLWFCLSQAGPPSGSATCGTCQMDVFGESPSHGHIYCTWESLRGLFVFSVFIYRHWRSLIQYIQPKGRGTWLIVSIYDCDGPENCPGSDPVSPWTVLASD